MIAKVGWWGFPNQSHHEDTFTLPGSQNVTIIMDQNVTEVRVFMLELHEPHEKEVWVLVWSCKVTNQSRVLNKGNYRVDCGRNGPGDAIATVNY